MGRTAFYQTDGFGRVLDPCPNCGHEVPVPRIRVGVHPDMLLPDIKDGQLRCQDCAHGLDGDVRFCARCTAQRAAKAEAEFHARRAAGETAPAQAAVQPAASMSGSKRPRRYQPKPCANDACRRMFTPTGPRALYCSTPCKGGK